MVSRKPMDIENKKLHIEVTSRCTLKCAACPRTTWKEITKIPFPKQDLNIDDFVKFMDCEGGRKVELLQLCGDYGDCIYYPDLIEFIKTFRNKKFRLHTNGSHGSPKFWNDLCKVLTEDDEIVLAIDGLEDTNHLYRKNSNWKSIMQAVDILSKSSVKLAWQTIIFKFNEDQLEQIQELAESKNIRWFSLKTHRYEDTNLIPTKESNIQTHYLFKPEYTNQETFEIEPKCYRIKTVGSDGIFYPCDWIRNPRTLYSSQLWKDRYWLDQLHIKNTNFDNANKIIKDWSEHVRSCGLKGNAEVLCKMKCRKEVSCHD